MPLEATDTIEGLVSSNPTGTDNTNEGNDHMQLIKSVLKNIFPGIGGQGFAIPIISTEVELNYVAGVTSSIQDQINQEIADRTAADEAIIVDYEAADIAIIALIDQEVLDRTAADDALALDIVAEADARTAADIVLQDAIDLLTLNTGNSFDAVELTTDALDVRVTNLENAPPFEEFPVTTVMMFAQAAPPPGWVQLPADDMYLKVVSGAGGGSGGAVSPTAGHTHTTGDHSLIIAEMPSHNHDTQIRNTSQGVNGGSGTGTPAGLTAQTSDLTGGGGAHNHGATGNPGEFRFFDVIIATKS